MNHNVYIIGQTPRFSLVILGSSGFGLFSLELSIDRFFGKDVAIALCIKKLAHSPSIIPYQNSTVSNSN